MNYLAHIYLSGDNPQLKIGNFIADSVKGKQFIKFSPEIQKGIILHRAIDNFTDTHKIVKKSVHRLFPMYSHYSTVIVDILYDHFLASNWKMYCEIPLEDYAQDFYGLLYDNFEDLPEKVQQFLPYMEEDNWLVSYKSINGIEKILGQMDRRTKNRSGMKNAVKELELYYNEFEQEFKMFFTELEDFTTDKINQLH
ncbi:MAG: acyl carrier protein phosphodiesterase [Gillisia sp.]